MLFEIDKHLSRSLRVQYYKTNKIIAGDILIEDKYPYVECMTDLEKFFKKLNIDLKNFWELLYDNLNTQNAPDLQDCEEYGITFPDYDNFKVDNSDYGFLKLYLGKSKIIGRQNWENIEELLSDQRYEDFFENNIDKDSILILFFLIA